MRIFSTTTRLLCRVDAHIVRLEKAVHREGREGREGEQSTSLVI
jgi:hypothetical protein